MMSIIATLRAILGEALMKLALTVLPKREADIFALCLLRYLEAAHPGVAEAAAKRPV